MITEPTLQPSAATRPDRAMWTALLANEWHGCRHSLIGLALVWVIGGWILVLFSHPGWLLAIGLAYCILLAGSHAGTDIMDGTEEFSFSLPPGRGPLYLARMVPGLVFLIVIGGLGGLTIAADLPQRVWSLVFSSGLTEPFAPVRDRYWYPLAVCVPLAAFAFTFTAASLARSRAAVSLAWIVGLLGGGVVTGCGILMENLLWRETNGLLSCPALLTAATLVLVGGHLLYQRKEATRSGGAPAGGFGLAAWILIPLIALLLLFVLGTFTLRKANASTLQHELRQRELQDQHEQRQHEQRQLEQQSQPARQSGN